MSCNVIKTIGSLKIQMNFMAEGDFSQEIPENTLNKKDELGEISQAVKYYITNKILIIES